MKALILTLAAFAGVASIASRNGLVSVSHPEIAAFIGGCLITRILYTAIYPFWLSSLRHLPTPKGSNFITGHALMLLRGSSPYTYITVWSRKWPDAPFVRMLSVANAEVLIPNTLAAFKGLVLDHAYDMDKGSDTKTIAKHFAGGGLFFAMGETHKRLRRVISGPISKPNVRNTFSMMRTCACEMSQDLDNIIQGASNGVLDMQHFFNKVTLEIVGLAITGERIAHLRSRDAGLTFQQCYARMLHPDALGSAITFLQVFVPLRWLPIKTNREFFEADRELRSMMRQLIENRRTEALVDEKSGQGGEGRRAGRRDVLSKLIAANLHGSMITDEELMDCALQFIIAGHETIARTMAWLMSELVRRPDVVARLRKEIADAKSQQPDLDSLTVESLPYLHNVIRECLRMYPPATTLNWEAIRDVEVEGVAIPKGTQVLLVPRIINRHLGVWGEDADEFMPDRWDNLAGQASDAYAIQTFINGPRMCPGIPLVMLEMRVLVIELMENFDFELVDPNKVITDCHPTVTLKIRDGLPVRVRRRAPQV